jgi:hypothetical protein
LPILVEKFTGDDKDAQKFVMAIFKAGEIRMYFDEGQFSYIYNKLMQWSPNDSKDQRVDRLLWLLFNAKNDGEMVIKFLRETIQKSDAKRFQWLFVNYTPPTFDNMCLLLGKGEGTLTPLGLALGIEVVTGSQRAASAFPPEDRGFRSVLNYDSLGIVYLSDGTKTMVVPRLTPFGHSLLSLLRTEGAGSDNESIRTLSQKVVEGLEQIEALEGE